MPLLALGSLAFKAFKALRLYNSTCFVRRAVLRLLQFCIQQRISLHQLVSQSPELKEQTVLHSAAHQFCIS